MSKTHYYIRVDEAFSGELASALPLARAYNDTIADMHSTNEVVRYIDGGDAPTLHVQHRGWVSVDQLDALSRLANCRVEVRPLSPQHVAIYMFGGVGRETVYPCYDNLTLIHLRPWDD